MRILHRSILPTSRRIPPNQRSNQVILMRCLLHHPRATGCRVQLVGHSLCIRCTTVECHRAHSCIRHTPIDLL